MRRRLPLLLAVLLAAAVAGWTASWHWIAGEIQAGIDGWIAARQAEGLSAGRGELTVSGFPFHWQVTVKRPAIAGAGPTGWRWQGAAVDARLTPWSWRRIVLRFPGDHVFAAGDGNLREELTLRAARPDGTIDLAADGRLDRIELDLGQAELALAPDGTATRAGRLRAGVTLHRMAGADHRADTFDLAVAIDDVTFARPPLPPLGASLAHAGLDLGFRGRLTGGKFADAVTAWRDSGGTIEFNRVAVRWGSIEAEGDGTFALDDLNRPLAAFTARWRGYGEFVDALAANGRIRPMEAAGVKIALGMLARQSPGETGGTVTIPLTAQDGRLFVAGFPILRIPPLRLD